MNIFFFSGPDSNLELDSLETDLILDNDEDCLEDSIQPIPAPIWPQKSRTEDQAIIELDSNYVSDISLKDSEKFTSVSRNGSFVRSIQFNKAVTPKMGSGMLRHHHSKVPRMLESQLTPIGEVQDDSKIGFQDSIGQVSH